MTLSIILVSETLKEPWETLVAWLIPLPAYSLTKPKRQDGFLRVFVPLALHDDLLATEDERLATLLREVHASVITDGREDGEEFANFRIGDHEDECGKLRGI